METVRSGMLLTQPLVLAGLAPRMKVMGTSNMRVDPVRLGRHYLVVVAVGVGRVMEPMEGVQSAVWAARLRPEAAVGEPGSQMVP